MVRAVRRFVRYAPSKNDAQRLVDIRVTDMTASDALWWDTRLVPKLAGDPRRADRFWAWTALLPMCHLVQLAKRRFLRPLVIWARADNRRFLRTGMSILIESYPHLDVGQLGNSYFVWFMSAADPEVLAADFGMSQPPALGRVLLDNAIVLSQNAGLGGRIGLHAAVAGGGSLLTVYKRCGLTQLPAGTALPPEVHRNNDGRFFYADDIQAEALATLLDPRR